MSTSTQATTTAPTNERLREFFDEAARRESDGAGANSAAVQATSRARSPELAQALADLMRRIYELLVAIIRAIARVLQRIVGNQHMQSPQASLQQSPSPKDADAEQNQPQDRPGMAFAETAQQRANPALGMTQAAQGHDGSAANSDQFEGEPESVRLGIDALQQLLAEFPDAISVLERQNKDTPPSEELVAFVGQLRQDMQAKREEIKKQITDREQALERVAEKMTNPLEAQARNNIDSGLRPAHSSPRIKEYLQLKLLLEQQERLEDLVGAKLAKLEALHLDLQNRKAPTAEHSADAAIADAAAALKDEAARPAPSAKRESPFAGLVAPDEENEERTHEDSEDSSVQRDRSERGG